MGKAGDTASGLKMFSPLTMAHVGNKIVISIKGYNLHKKSEFTEYVVVLMEERKGERKEWWK